MEKKEEEKKDPIHLARLAEIYRHPYGSNFVYYIQEGTNNLYYFDLKLDRGKMIPIVDYKAPDQFDTAAIVNRIFICGGYRLSSGKSTFLKATYECVVEPKKKFANMVAKADMVHARSQHILCPIKGNNIYCMGGKNTESGKQECLNSVEKYDLTANAWTAVACNMNEKKMNMGSCAFNQEVIFVFGGYNYVLGGALETIEFFDTTKESEGWKIFEITKQMKKSWFPHYWMGAYHFANDKIAVFGGNDTDLSVVFTVSEKKMEKVERQVSYKVNFCQRKAEMWENEFKIVDYIRKDVNLFKIDKYWFEDNYHEYAFYPRKPIVMPEPPDYS